MAVVKSFQAIYKPWKGSHTMPTFALTPDVSLELDEPVARRLYRRMHEHFASQDTRTSDAAILDDNHPLWERHSGRSGPTGPDRQSVVSGKSVSVRVDLGGRRLIQKKKK